jgi:hypothetical protein
MNKYSFDKRHDLPLSNLKKKGIPVISSLSSIRLGLCPYRLGKKGVSYWAGARHCQALVDAA